MIGNDVLTERGVRLGVVRDLVLLVGSTGEVVGYQIEKPDGGQGLHPPPRPVGRLRHRPGGPRHHRGLRPRRPRRPGSRRGRIPDPIGAGMTDSFQRAAGRKVLSRASAQDLGTVDHLLLDAQRPQIAAVIIGKGKKAQLVEWAHLSGFGPDAVMVGDEAALRPPADDRERAAADGKLELVGKRVLTEKGNELGTVDDVTFDPDTGALATLRIGDREIPADRLLGSGSYAIVVDASQEPA